jgi:hypothetical protein
MLAGIESREKRKRNVPSVCVERVRYCETCILLERRVPEYSIFVRPKSSHRSTSDVEVLLMSSVMQSRNLSCNRRLVISWNIKFVRWHSLEILYVRLVCLGAGLTCCATRCGGSSAIVASRANYRSMEYDDTYH